MKIPMGLDREFDIYEKSPDGSEVFRASAIGMANVWLKLAELAWRSGNARYEYFATHAINGQIVATVKNNDRRPSHS